MSDGAVLFASVGYPANKKTGKRASGKFPVLLAQNPYTGATSQPDKFFVSRGYIFVSAEVRGTQQTEGPHGTEVADELWSRRDTQDGVELVRWAAHHLAGSNGIIGLTGCSYLGINEVFTAAAIGPHSAIKAIIPACTSNSYDVYFSGGIPSQEGWLLSDSGAILGTKNAAANAAFGTPLGNEIHAGEGRAYNDAFWQQRTTANVGVQIVRNGIPALLWSGWGATEMPGPLELYSIFQNTWANRPVFGPMKADQRTTGRYQVIVGPGSHGEGLDESIELEWYDTWLKGQKTGMTQTSTPMHLYELGSGRWVNAASYPLVGTYTPYYLGAKGALSTQRPTTAGADTIAWGQPAQSGTTLTYMSSPSSRGATIAGPIAASIYASSNNKNLELIATLNDVAADGTIKEITTGALLGSLRAVDTTKSWYDKNGLFINPDHPYLADRHVPAGETERYDIKLNSTLWSLQPGHSLQLVVSTEAATADCGISLTSLPIALPCHLTGTQVTTVPGGVYKIDFASTTPSSLNLPLLPYGSLPTAPSGSTATSAGQTEPLGWSSARP